MCIAGQLLTSQLNILPITVERNAYGRQVASFEEPIRITEKLNGKQTVENTIFIRAPVIRSLNDPEVEVVAMNSEEVVGVKKGNIIGTSFHPEITPSLTWHRAFLDCCVDVLQKSN